MTGEELLAKLKIDPTDSIYKIIEFQNHAIYSASNPGEKANLLLMKFGVDAIQDPQVARLTAVALIRELVLDPKKFNIQKAQKEAHKSVVKAFTVLGKVIPTEDKADRKKVSKSDDNYKMTKAMEVYKKHSHKSVKKCTEQIAKALKIPYTSAYYYHRKISKG